MSNCLPMSLPNCIANADGSRMNVAQSYSGNWGCGHDHFGHILVHRCSIVSLSTVGNRGKSMSGVISRILTP